MTTINTLFVDPAFHGSTFPTTYVVPGVLQALGCTGAAPGTTTGTASAASPWYVAADTNTWTLVAANCVSFGGGMDDGIAGYLTVPTLTNITNLIIPVGFSPSHVHVIDWTNYVEYEYFLGAPATDTIKRFASSTYNAVDTNTIIAFTADAAGGVGNTGYLTIKTSIFTAADVASFRISQ